MLKVEQYSIHLLQFCRHSPTSKMATETVQWSILQQIWRELLTIHRLSSKTKSFFSETKQTKRMYSYPDQIGPKTIFIRTWHIRRTIRRIKTVKLWIQVPRGVGDVRMCDSSKTNCFIPEQQAHSPRKWMARAERSRCEKWKAVVLKRYLWSFLCKHKSYQGFMPVHNLSIAFS